MSESGRQAQVFVAAHRGRAIALGERLAGLIDEPDRFLAALREGLRSLADPAFTEMAELASPGTRAPYAVRAPLLDAVERPLRRALREGSSMPALLLARHLVEAGDRDLRLFALPCLRRALAEDPEQTWQLLRRMAHRAGDWIEVDSLADVWARGVLAETFRWAELEQLVYSQRAFERRLVGATLATIPHRVPPARRGDLRTAAVERALPMVGLLMGDAEEPVQKALSWAIREWTRVDAEATAELLRAEASIAARQADGHRAWVIRHALAGQPAELASGLRRRLLDVRRDRRAPSTSVAARQAAGFAAALATTNEAVAMQGHRYTRSRP